MSARVSATGLSGMMLLLCAFAGPAVADSKLGSGAAIASGHCTNVMIGGEDLAKTCDPKVASVTLSDGTVMFIFSYERRMVAFSGSGRSVQGIGSGKARLPLQFVSIGTEKPDLDVLRVLGACDFGTPYAGAPAPIECSATSYFGQVSAQFLTDGQPPKQQTK